MDLDVGNSENERITRDVDLVSEEEKVGVDGEGKEESNSLLSPREGGIEDMQKNSRRKVRWNDRNGNKLAEVWEFQPR